MVAKTQRPETRTVHAVPINMHLEKSIGIILMMYNQLQLSAAAISNSEVNGLTKYFSKVF